MGQFSENDPHRLLERQATEVFLTGLASSHPHGAATLLKGGTLMGMKYGSARHTADLDFTSTLEPLDALKDLRATLDQEMLRAAASLGYPDLNCRVQKINRQPREKGFEYADAPGLKVTVGYAVRGTGQEGRLRVGQSTQVLKIDISFRERIYNWEVIKLGADGAEILVYSVYEIIAEKLRALLQQVHRNRYRRQDVYDLALLVTRMEFSNENRKLILEVLKGKCEIRGIVPMRDSISDPEVRSRAEADWETMALELEELPTFASCYDKVEQFYHDLPW